MTLRGQRAVGRALLLLLVTARWVAAGTGDMLCDAVKSTPDTCVIVGSFPVDNDTVLTFGRPNLELRGTLTVQFDGVCSLEPALPCASDSECGAPPAVCLRTGRLTVQAAEALTVTSTGKIRARGQAVTGDRIGPAGGTVTLVARDVTIGGLLDVSAAGGGVPAGRAGDIAVHADGNVTLATSARLIGSTADGCGGRVTIDGAASAALAAGAQLDVKGVFGGAIQLAARDYLGVGAELTASNTLSDFPTCQDSTFGGGGLILLQAGLIEFTGSAKAVGTLAPGGTVRFQGERGVTVDSGVGTTAISVSGGDRFAFFAGGGVFLDASAGDVIVRGGAIEANGVGNGVGSDAGAFRITAAGMMRCDGGMAPCGTDADCDPGDACVETGGNVLIQAPVSAAGEAGTGSGCFFCDISRCYTCEIRGTGDVTVNASVNVGGGKHATGGKVTIAAGRDLTVGPEPVTASAGDGGDVVLIAGERAGVERGVDGHLIIVDATSVRADARDDGGFGGSVEIDGCIVEVSPGVSVNVNAMTGGSSGAIDVTAHDRLIIGPLAAFWALPSGMIALSYRNQQDVSPDATFQPPTSPVQDPTIPLCPRCGNSVTESPEDCDGPGSCPVAFEVCQPADSLNACTCQDTCGTKPGIQPGEECDGTDLGTHTCVTQGFLGGTLGCRADCTFDTSGCTSPITTTTSSTVTSSSTTITTSTTSSTVTTSSTTTTTSTVTTSSTATTTSSTSSTSPTSSTSSTTIPVPTCDSCDDRNPCTADSCDPVTGCRHASLADGAPCGDGDACNGEETCRDGVCAPGSAPSCADGNPCTLDTCSASAGCLHARLGYGEAIAAVETSLLLQPCVSVRLPPAVHQLLGRARVLLERARGASSSKRRLRLVRRATSKLTAALAKAERAARRGLPASCADPLRRLINEAIGRSQCLPPP